MAPLHSLGVAWDAHNTLQQDVGDPGSDPNLFELWHAAGLALVGLRYGCSTREFRQVQSVFTDD